jgi:hypothetical protein
VCGGARADNGEETLHSCRARGNKNNLLFMKRKTTSVCGAGAVLKEIFSELISLMISAVL